VTVIFLVLLFGLIISCTLYLRPTAFFRLKSIVFAYLITVANLSVAQVILPVNMLNYDAPALPPILWPTSQTVTRDLALLPIKTLVEKNNTQKSLPYRFEVTGAYKNTGGDFGLLNTGDNSRKINYNGNVYSSQIHFPVQRDDLFFGVIGAYERLDLSAFEQQRYGIMPYGRWRLPLTPLMSINFLGTF